jgi:hypothetical protein
VSRLGGGRAQPSAQQAAEHDSFPGLQALRCPPLLCGSFAGLTVVAGILREDLLKPGRVIRSVSSSSLIEMVAE